MLFKINVRLLWRRHTHWSMFFAGGTCFLLIDWINNGMEGDYSRKLDIALTALMPVLRANCRSAKAAAAADR